MPRSPGYDTFTGRWCTCGHREEDHQAVVLNPTDEWRVTCMVCECDGFEIKGQSPAPVKPLDHRDDHDPILGDEWDRGCAACLAARNSTFAQLRHIEPGLGPRDTAEFIGRMQEMAREHLRVVRS